ncbi:MAG: hypothetical protein AAGA60_03260 [Cyanobacteria bacterium P01_E01_bin.42]
MSVTEDIHLSWEGRVLRSPKITAFEEYRVSNCKLYRRIPNPVKIWRASKILARQNN